MYHFFFKEASEKWKKVAILKLKTYCKYNYSYYPFVTSIYKYMQIIRCLINRALIT